MAEKIFRNVVGAAKDDLSELEQVEEECEENHTEVSEIDLLCIKLAAEKRADERDSVLAKQLHLGNKAGQIVILGLHNAGKTTLLTTLKDNPFDEYTSSLSSNYEELIMGNMKFTAFNLGDRNAQGVHLWKDSIPRPDSIVFLIDDLLKDEGIFSVIIPILGSKYDLFGRKSDSQKADDEESLRVELGLSKETMEQHKDGRHLRNSQVYVCNMNDICTFGCAFRYIGRFLNET